MVEAGGQPGWLMITDMEIEKIISLSIIQLKYMKGGFFSLKIVKLQARGKTQAELCAIDIVIDIVYIPL